MRRLALTLDAVGSGCTFFDGTCDDDDRDCLATRCSRRAVGGTCTRTGECKDGLFCDRGHLPAHGDDTERGDGLPADRRVRRRPTTAAPRACAALAGDSDEGGDCADQRHCEHGLVCEPPDLSQLGTLSLGALAELRGLCDRGRQQGAGRRPAIRVSDCLAGLACCRELAPAASAAALA